MYVTIYGNIYRETLWEVDMEYMPQSHGNIADHMEQDEANEDFLPGIGELKTFSQVIRSQASLGFKIELTDAFTFVGNRTTETLFQVTLNMGTVSCPISGHFLQNCNILTQNSTNELKLSHNVASTAGN